MDQIADEFRQCVENTIKRLEGKDTFRPFHDALLPEDAVFWSRFERSFSTSFGQRAIEKISKLAALSGGAKDAANQHQTDCILMENQLREIENHMAKLRSKDRSRPNWKNDLAGIASIAPKGTAQKVRVISDLWWKKNGINHYMSIKTVKPNIDQTAEAKRDLLKLKVSDPTCRPYFGLYYNPYGAKKEQYAHSQPMGIFDFRSDEVVLIGKEYWDTLGGLGFYEEVLKIAVQVGNATRPLIADLGL